MRKNARLVIGFFLSALGLWVALRGISWPDFWAAWRGIQKPWMFLLFPAACGLEFFLRAERWRMLLSPLPSRVGAFFSVTAGGFFLNNILPLRAGEAARVYWTAKRTASPLPGIVAVLGLDRVFDVAAMSLLLGTVLFFRENLFPRSMVVSFLAALFAGLAVLIALAWAPESFFQRVEARGLPRKLTGALRSFAGGASVLRSPGRSAELFLLSLSFWVMNAGLYAAAARMFGLQLSLLDGIALILAFAAGAALPSAPGYVGVLEAAGVALLGALGFSRETAFPFVLTIHLSQILSTAIFGLPSIFHLGKENARA